MPSIFVLIGNHPRKVIQWMSPRKSDVNKLTSDTQTGNCELCCKLSYAVN
jgi:hypothetical protein